ncbi:hypothetical protein WA158_004669 [Blastocystis sp. Blastoise]
MDVNLLSKDISDTLYKSLCDKSSQKRRAAAEELSQKIAFLCNKNDLETVGQLIDILLYRYGSSSISSEKKGLLNGLAAIAVGLKDYANRYLDQIILPILSLFSDTDSSLRFYAIESLYNVILVVRDDCLKYFEQIFDGLCYISDDINSDVQTYANVLNNKFLEIAKQSQFFDEKLFISILIEKKDYSKHRVRSLLLTWISELDHIHTCCFLSSLPEFLKSLLFMLDDAYKEIKQKAYNVLDMFLKEINEAETSTLDLQSMMTILLDTINSTNQFIRDTSVQWIEAFLKKNSSWNPPYPRIFSGLQSLISTNESPEIRDLAYQCYELIETQLKDTETVVDISEFITVLNQLLNYSDKETKLLCLQTLQIIIAKDKNNNVNNESLKRALINVLGDSDESLIGECIHSLVALASSGTPLRFFIPDIIDKFLADQKFLESRGCLIFRTLCKYLSVEDVYTVTSSTLKECKDYVSISLIIHMLNVILLTADETQELRILLRCCFSNYKKDPEQYKKGKEIYDQIYESWCINPIAALSLCWLVEDYELAYHIILHLGCEEFSLSLLMQADKLVQFLESPVYYHMRLHLIEPNSPILKPLLQSLYGFLMLLPQSHGYKVLQARLSGVVQLHLALQNYSETSEPSEEYKEKETIFIEKQQMRLDGITKNI